MTDSPQPPATDGLPLRGRWLMELGRARIGQIATAAGLRRRTTYVWERVAEHRACWERAAAGIGADFVALSDHVWEVRRGERRTRIANDRLQLDDPVVLEIAGDKLLCHELAAGEGVPMPEYRLLGAHRVEEAWRHVAADGHPFVVKPARGTSAGIGVTVGVRTRPQLVRAMATAAVRDRRVLLERMIPGESCRLLFLDGELLHAVRRSGVHVATDGTSTLGALMAAAGHGALADDPMTLAQLAARDLTPASVPAAHPRFVVRGLPAGETSAREVRTVYDEVITDQLDASLVADAARMAAAIGSAWAGVDVVTPDPTRPLSDGGAVLEVNTTPGILHHCPPDSERCEVAERVLERLLGSDA